MNGKTFALLVLVLTIARTLLVTVEDISANEAYYAICASHPAPAYFDGPPGTAALTALGKVAPSLPDTLWRFWAPVWALIATVACYQLVRAMDGPVIACWTALALNALPIFNSAAVRVRPEPPALALVLLGLWRTWAALHAERNAVLHWAGAAACIALAAQFSYISLCIIPGIALFVLCSRKHRRLPDFAGLLFLVALPLALLIPALQWNASLEWIALVRGTFRTALSFDFAGFMLGSLPRLLDKFSPLLLVALFAAWVAALRESVAHFRARFIALCTLPAILLTVYFAWLDEDPLLYLLLAAPLLLYKLIVWLPGKRFGKVTIGVCFLFAGIFSLKSVKWAYDAGVGWKEAAAALEEEFLKRSAEGQEGIFLIAGDAPIASATGYYLKGQLVPPPGHPAVYQLESQDISSQFGLWPGYDDFIESDHVADEYFTEQKGENPFVGRDALYLSREKPDDVPYSLKAAFESVTFLKQLSRPGNERNPLFLYFCKSYQTLPL